METNRQEVKNWLLNKLEKSPSWVVDLNAETSSWRTVRICKMLLGIKSYRAKHGWIWYNPVVSSLDDVRIFAKNSYPSDYTGPKASKNRQLVTDWLKERCEHPAWVVDIKSQIAAFAWDVPLGWRTVEKCKKTLGIRSYHAPMGWIWYLPQVHLDAVKAFAEDSYPASMPVTANGLTSDEIRGMAVMALADPDRPGDFRTATQVELIVMKQCRSEGIKENLTAEQVREIIRCQVFDEMGRPSDLE